MMNEQPDELSERDEIEALLPWYVSGKLDAHARARVERYVKTHPEGQGPSGARPRGERRDDHGERSHSPRRDLRRSTDCGRASPPRRGASRSARRSATSPIGSAIGSPGWRRRSWRSRRRWRRSWSCCKPRRSAHWCLERAGAPTYQTAGGEQTAGESIELLVGFADTATIGEIAALLEAARRGGGRRTASRALSPALAGHRRRGPQGRHRGSATVGGGDGRAAGRMRSMMRFICALA